MRFLNIVILSLASILFLTISANTNAYENQDIYLPEIEVNIDALNGNTAEQPRLLRFPEFNQKENSAIKLIPPKGSSSSIKLKPIVKKEKAAKKNPKKTVKKEALPDISYNNNNDDNNNKKTDPEPPIEEAATPVDSSPLSIISETSDHSYSPVPADTAAVNTAEKNELSSSTSTTENATTATDTSIVENNINKDEEVVAPPQNIADGIYEMSIIFEESSSAIPEKYDTEINKITESIKNNDNISLRLMSYAKGDDETSSRARRLSLSRALAVRSKFMDYGIRSTRIEVRALGSDISGSGQDRMDIYTIKR